MLARSRARIDKERTMRPRKLKWLWAGSRSSAMRLKRDEPTDETRRRAQQGKGGVAVGGHRSGSADRQLQPHAQPRQLRKVRREGATCSAPISTNTRRRSCRSSTSEPQGRPGSAPDLPSNDRADRSAHLRHLHGLLSPRHVACESEPVGGRPHAEAVLNKFAAIQIIDVRFPTTEVRT